LDGRLHTPIFVIRDDDALASTFAFGRRSCGADALNRRRARAVDICGLDNPATDRPDCLDSHGKWQPLLLICFGSEAEAGRGTWQPALSRPCSPAAASRRWPTCGAVAWFMLSRLRLPVASSLWDPLCGRRIRRFHSASWRRDWLKRAGQKRGRVYSGTIFSEERERAPSESGPRQAGDASQLAIAALAVADRTQTPRPRSNLGNPWMANTLESGIFGAPEMGLGSGVGRVPKHGDEPHFQKGIQQPGLPFYFRVWM
jgi:hypothetical protein